ncbi:lipocalin-like domain-containing protein [soil metagenome]
MLPTMHRRALLLSLLAGPGLAPSAARAGIAGPVRPRPLAFPADFGAHPDTRTEWWYVTGALQADSRTWGFQVTFFRSSTDVAAAQPSAFAARQLVFAHAAITDLQQGRLQHDQRIARAGFGIAEAGADDTRVTLRNWHLDRQALPGGSRYTTQVRSDSAGFALDLQMDTTQPLLLQGDAGYSRKGPRPAQASHYYSQPQLAVQGRLRRGGEAIAVTGRAWLDHEWSDSLLDAEAVGWDWIGMNLDDGAALTAFRLRRADGSALYAGGSFRAVGQTARIFGAGEVVFTPGRMWQSPSSKARYPVEWRVRTPSGSFTVRALLDDQELDSRSSTGSIYWEGLSDLLDDRGLHIGRGYLELTGYAASLRL